MLAAVKSLQADAAITYVETAGLSRVRTWPLYEKCCCLLTANPGFAGYAAVISRERASLPLSLPTGDMQNRPIIDARLLRAGGPPAPVLQTNARIVLMTHVQTGHWASVMPAMIADGWGVRDR